MTSRDAQPLTYLVGVLVLAMGALAFLFYGENKTIKPDSAICRDGYVPINSYREPQRSPWVCVQGYRP